MKTCPHCGSKHGYSVQYRVQGWNKYHGQFSEFEEEVDEFNAQYGGGSTVVCDACKKRSPHPYPNIWP